MGPSGEGEPPRLTVAVDDLGTGLWTSKLKQVGSMTLDHSL